MSTKITAAQQVVIDRITADGFDIARYNVDPRSGILQIEVFDGERTDAYRMVWRFDHLGNAI